MDIKYKFTLFAASIFACLCFATCKKKGECVSNAYLFQSTWKVSPEHDSINIGDTLTLICMIPQNSFDSNLNKLVDLGNDATINTPISFARIDSSGELFPAVDSFYFLVNKGQVFTDPSINPHQIKQALLLDYSGIYQLEFRIIAQKKGMYAVGVPNAFLRLATGKPCTDEGYVNLYNNNADNHLHYYKDFYYHGAPVPSEDSVHGYIFRVK